MKDIILIEASSKSTYQRKYKCPYCEQKFERTKLHIHIQNKHEELIPEGYTALRVAFNTINNKTEGHCIMCGKVSDWNEDKGRYERLCNDPKCHEAYKRMAAERNKKKYGTERLQSDPRYAEEVQRKALQGRRIAGKYKFSDDGEIDYLGAYERRLLEFMDKVMKCKSEDIAAPGPTIKYMYQDKEHLYISDFYYIPYNLIIEVKDGGDNPNTNPALRGYKTERQEAKEAAVKATGKYNYVRQTNNDFSQIMSIMAVLKYNLQNECYDPIMRINEMVLIEQLESKLSLSKFLRDNSIDDAYELYNWMHKNIKYKSTGRYQSPEETIEKLSGDCHDQAELAYRCLMKLGYQVGKVFMVEYYDYEKPGGRTHTLTYFLSNNNYYWFENAWGNKAGIHKLKGKQFVEILKPVFESWDWSGKCDKLYWTPFRANPKYGCDLGEYVGLLTPEKEPKKNIYYKDKSLNESILFNEKDIYYNKDKFDSGEINLCFITGHSGSGKSTMARDMQKNNVEHYELDDLQCIKDHFTMSQLKEYGDLIYSYFNGPGKKFYMTYQELVDNKIPGSEYEDKLFPGFVHYAMQYAKSHKDRKYVIEGVWLFCNDDNGSPWFKPEEFKDYAFYIKGTSMIVSKWRAAKRDAEDNDNSFDRLRYSSKNFFFNNWKWYFIDEKQINRFRNYFKKISINESMLYESDDASKLDKNFKHKSGIEFDIVDIRDKKVKGNIDEIKGKYKDYFKGFAAFEKRTDNFAGFIRIWPDWVLEEKYHGNLISPVKVKSKYRGYGLGRLLVEKSMEKFNANMLMVAKDNEVAINMYKKLGFSISQNTKWKNEDYYIMTTNTVKLLKSTNKITEDMSGTIGAALAPTTKGANIIKPLPVPTPYESDQDHYLVVNTRPDQKLSYSITRDPLQYTLYSVDPQEKGFYKVFKSDKGKISKNYLTFKIKDKKKAKELYENLTELYKRNLTFMDHGLSSDVNENYIYSYLTDGNNIITPDQILFDNRFELVRSFEESVNYESSKIYNYLLNGYSIEDELNILSEQVKELEEDINE